MANFGTIYDSQDLPQEVLPDRQPEDWEMGLAGERSPLEEQAAETSLDSPDEGVRGADTPVGEAADVPGSKWDIDVRLKAAHSRFMKMDDAETLRAKKIAQQHPRFLQFMIEMKEYITDETDCLVLWDVWCNFYDLSVQGKSVPEILATPPVERHTTKENIKKFFSPDTYRKKKDAQDLDAAAGTTEKDSKLPEDPCLTTAREPEFPEVPLLTAAEQRGLRAAKAERSKRKGKGKGSKALEKEKAKKKTKKMKGKKVRKSKSSRKAAHRIVKAAKRATEAEDDQSRKRHKTKSPEEGDEEQQQQQCQDRAPQLVSKDEQAILKKKPECEISTLLRTLSCIYRLLIVGVCVCGYFPLYLMYV